MSFPIVEITAERIFIVTGANTGTYFVSNAIHLVHLRSLMCLNINPSCFI